MLGSSLERLNLVRIAGDVVAYEHADGSVSADGHCDRLRDTQPEPCSSRLSAEIMKQPSPDFGGFERLVPGLPKIHDGLALSVENHVLRFCRSVPLFNRPSGGRDAARLVIFPGKSEPHYLTLRYAYEKETERVLVLDFAEKAAIGTLAFIEHGGIRIVHQ